MIPKTNNPEWELNQINKLDKLLDDLRNGIESKDSTGSFCYDSLDLADDIITELKEYHS